MTERQWKENLKKYLYLLPYKEEKDILQYYEELFSDYYAQGYTEEEIIQELEDPKEVAKAMVADYLDDSDAIDKKEEHDKNIDPAQKAHDMGLNIRNKFVRVGNNFVSFCDGLSADTRKKNSPLSNSERQEYETEIRRHREEEQIRKQETLRREAQDKKMEERRKAEEIRRQKEEEAQNARKAEQTKEREQQKMTGAKYYEINDDEDEDYESYNGPTSKKLKRKTYTQAQRHSFLTNFMYIVFMILFIIIGLAVSACAGGALVMTIIATIKYAVSGIAVGSQLLVDIGYIILNYGALLLILGIGLGIFIGSIKKIHKRFFKKRYIMIKRNFN